MQSGVNVLFMDKLPEGAAARYSVIAARSSSGWVYGRKREAQTYEIPGGHIEAGESAEEAARRELYEETGALDFTLSFVSYYGVERDAHTSYGALFFADIDSFGDIPAFETAIAERCYFESLPPPDEMTYPHIQPLLLKCVQDRLTQIQPGS